MTTATVLTPVPCQCTILLFNHLGDRATIWAKDGHTYRFWGNQEVTVCDRSISVIGGNVGVTCRRCKSQIAVALDKV